MQTNPETLQAKKIAGQNPQGTNAPLPFPRGMGYGLAPSLEDRARPVGDTQIPNTSQRLKDMHSGFTRPARHRQSSTDRQTNTRAAATAQQLIQRAQTSPTQLPGPKAPQDAFRQPISKSRNQKAKTTLPNNKQTIPTQRLHRPPPPRLRVPLGDFEGVRGRRCRKKSALSISKGGC